MTTTHRTAALLATASLALGSAGCSKAQDIALTEADAAATTEAGKLLLVVAQTLGILPDYDCGKAERLQFAGLRPKVGERVGSCGTVGDLPATAEADRLGVQFVDTGCKAVGLDWKGSADLSFSGGDDRCAGQLDLTKAIVNNVPLTVKAGLTKCADLKTYSVKASGTVPYSYKEKPHTVGVAFDGEVTDRPGIAVVGVDQYVINGPASLTIDGATHKLTFQQVYWSPVEKVPAKGTIVLEKADGRKLTFTWDTFSVKGRVAVDDDDPLELNDLIPEKLK